MSFEIKQATIPLTNGLSAIVDADDFERLSAHKWYAMKVGGSFYAARNSSIKGGASRKTIFMHREALGAGSPRCDHINRNTLDNRKANLRAATVSQNAANCPLRKDKSSRFRGVHWDRSKNKWCAYISLSKTKNKNLGRFHVEEDAAKAYDAAAFARFGEFAQLNFPKQ